MVATIGKLNSWPGASNVIPGRTVFTVDLRAQTNLARRAAVAWLGDEIMAIAKRRGVTAWVERTHEADARPCDPVLQAGIAGAIIRQSGKAVHLPSGAGHDGQAIGALCPIGMLFVRCRGGISHSPAEFTSVKDMGQAIAALIDFIENFDPTKVGRLIAALPGPVEADDPRLMPRTVDRLCRWPSTGHQPVKQRTSSPLVLRRGLPEAADTRDPCRSSRRPNAQYSRRVDVANLSRKGGLAEEQRRRRFGRPQSSGPWRRSVRPRQ